MILRGGTVFYTGKSGGGSHMPVPPPWTPPPLLSLSLSLSLSLTIGWRCGQLDKPQGARVASAEGGSGRLGWTFEIVVMDLECLLHLFAAGGGGRDYKLAENLDWGTGVNLAGDVR